VARILFAEQFYFPEAWGGAEIPRDITTHLQKLGFDITVVCGGDEYVEGGNDPACDPREYGVRINRIPRLFPGPIHQLKALRQTWFYIGSIPLSLFRRRPDLFVTQTNPPLLVVIVAGIAKLTNRPLIIVAMDLYPEALVAHGALDAKGAPARLLTRLFSWAYRSATRVVSLGPVMSQRLVAKGVSPDQIAEISNWATGKTDSDPASRSELREDWNLAGQFVLLYSGNLGTGHEFKTLVSAFAETCREKTGKKLVFVGRGKRLEETRRLVDKLSIGEHIEFRDFVSAEQLPDVLAMADLAIVTLRPGFGGLIAPSKLLGYMARGLPVLYVGPDSDASRLIEASGCGIVARNDDVDAVSDAIEWAFEQKAALVDMGEAGRRFYEQNLRRDLALLRYQALTTECLEEAR